MKKAVWIGVAVFVLVVTALLVAPAFVDLSMFKRTYLPFIEEAIHRQVDVDEVRLSLIPTPSIKLSNLKVSDTSAFPDNTFFSAQQVQLRLKLWPLIRGRFEVTEFVLEKPVINVLKHPDGTFNYADIAGKRTPAADRREAKKKSAAAKSQDAVAMPLIVPTRMRIKEGQLNLETKGQKPVKISGIDLSLEEFSTEHPFPYRASFDYPGLKSVSLEGQLRYQEDQATLTLRDNRLKIRDLRLPVEGSVSNLSTIPRVHLTSSNANVDAKAIFQILSVFGLAPRDTDVSGPMEFHMSVTGPSHSLVTQLRGHLKDVQVNGKRAVKGKLSGDVFIQLPLGAGPVARRVQGDGKLVARDGELTNVDLVKKIQHVTGMMGLSKNQRREATTFKTLETEFVIGDGIADFKRIYLTNPQMEVNGAGTMTLDQPTLNVSIETALTGEALSRAGRGRTANFFKDRQGRIVVPLKITGPVEKPSVNLDGEKILSKGMGENTEKGLGSFFKQLFRRR